MFSFRIKWNSICYSYLLIAFSLVFPLLSFCCFELQSGNSGNSRAKFVDLLFFCCCCCCSCSCLKNFHNSVVIYFGLIFVLLGWMLLIKVVWLFRILLCAKLVLMTFFCSFHYDFSMKIEMPNQKSKMYLQCFRCAGGTGALYEHFLAIVEASKWNEAHEKWRCNEHNK